MGVVRGRAIDKQRLVKRLGSIGSIPNDSYSPIGFDLGQFLEIPSFLLQLHFHRHFPKISEDLKLLDVEAHVVRGSDF